jgi:TPR repeat protein
MMKDWRIAIPPLLLAFVMAAYSGYQTCTAKADARRLAAYVGECRTKAEQGNPQFEAELGGLYRNGRGVPQDDAAALSWYRKAADQGFAGAEAGLGYCYRHGRGVAQSDAEAFRWYQLAAKQSDPYAETAVGAAYFLGWGVPQSDADAVRWFHKAADQKYPLAEYSLGWMELYGRGTPRNREEALRLYREAAARGDPEAQQAITRPFLPFTKYTLLIALLFNLWIVSEFFFDLPRFAEKTPQFRRQSILLFSGGLLSAALLAVT